MPVLIVLTALPGIAGDWSPKLAAQYLDSRQKDGSHGPRRSAPAVLASPVTPAPPICSRAPRCAACWVRLSRSPTRPAWWKACAPGWAAPGDVRKDVKEPVASQWWGSRRSSPLFSGPGEVRRAAGLGPAVVDAIP